MIPSSRIGYGCPSIYGTNKIFHLLMAAAIGKTSGTLMSNMLSHSDMKFGLSIQHFIYLSGSFFTFCHFLFMLGMSILTTLSLSGVSIAAHITKLPTVFPYIEGSNLNDEDSIFFLIECNALIIYFSFYSLISRI